MPNLKLFVDDTALAAQRPQLAAALPELRALLCAGLDVTPSACQLAVIAVMGLADQPAINAELHLLPRPERSRARREDLARRLRDHLAAATGLSVAVRIALLDGESYVALK